MVLVLSSMMMLRYDEDARTVLSFEYIVVMPHHLPSDLTIDYLLMTLTINY